MRHWDQSRIVLGALVAVTIVLVTATEAFAQRNYKTLPVDQRARSLGTVARRYIRSPGDAEDRKKLDDYLFKYHIPKMTQVDSESLGKLGDMRYDLLRSYLRPAQPALAADLTLKIFTGMKSIVPSAQYHRAVRYNGIVLIGQLDAKYAKDAGGGDPTPLPQATDFLCDVVRAGLSNPNVPAELVVGGLIGLDRHARFNKMVPQAQQAKLLATLFAVVDREQMPQELNREVEQWISMRACSALARFKNPGGGDAKIHSAIVKKIEDETYDVDSRVRIVGLMGEIDYASATGIDDVKTAKAILSLATAIGSSEAKFAKEFEDSQLTGRIGSAAYGLDEELLPSEYKRRRLLSRVTHLNNAIESVSVGITNQQAKEALGAITTAITKVAKAAGDKDTIDFDVATAAGVFDREIVAIADTYGVDVEENAIEEGDEDDEESTDEAAEPAEAPAEEEDDLGLEG